MGARVIILATPLDAAAANEHHRTPLDVPEPEEGKRHVAIIGEARVMTTELRVVTRTLITKSYPTIVLPMRLGIKHASSQRRRWKHFTHFITQSILPKHFASERKDLPFLIYRRESVYGVAC